jgi:predicted trehalose synthase
VRAFPCAAEVARIACWLDRPDLLARTTEARSTAVRLPRDMQSADPLACLGMVREVEADLRSGWEPGGSPPLAGSCQAHAADALGSYDRVCDESLRREAAEPIARMLARQHGDPHGCLLVAAEIRRSYPRTGLRWAGDGGGSPTAVSTCRRIPEPNAPLEVA